MHHPDAFKVAKDVLDRNKLTGYGAPEDQKNMTFAPQQPNTFKVNNAKLAELSDEGLDALERIVQQFRAVLTKSQPVTVEGTAK